MNRPVTAMTKRERRRRQNEEKAEVETNGDIVFKQNNVVEKEQKMAEENSRILIRRDTFTVSKPRATSDGSSSDDPRKGGGEAEQEISVVEDEFDTITRVRSESGSSKNLTHTINVETWSSELKNVTYGMRKEEEASGCDTYNLHVAESDKEVARPVPAPRRILPIVPREMDQLSSDTDRDVMEIEVDDLNVSSNADSLERDSGRDRPKTKDSDASVEPPMPKPRKLPSLSAKQQPLPKTNSLSKSKSLEEVTVRALSPRSVHSNPEATREELKSPPRPPEREDSSRVPRERKVGKFARLLQRRKREKTSGMFASVMRLERARIPTISSILRELKEESSKTKLEEEEEEEEKDKMDFQIESPHLPQSQPNDKLYVQHKNGFRLRNKDDVLEREEVAPGRCRDELGMKGAITTTMLRTAMLFQKFWSRSMIYFHGLLAGFGFGHAFAITAVLVYFNNEEKGFIDVYSSLALKIHFIFYSLTALCIVSCLDRLDVGHLSKRHWRRICSEFPSQWLVLAIYLASFSLTFANHRAESRFDGHRHENATGEALRDGEMYEQVPDVSHWYRIVWARDALVLVAWLLVSMTKYPDNLHLYVKDLSVNLNSGRAGGDGKRDLPVLKIDT